MKSYRKAFPEDVLANIPQKPKLSIKCREECKNGKILLVFETMTVKTIYVGFEHSAIVFTTQ
jgi:hypothetical protein